MDSISTAMMSRQSKAEQITPQSNNDLLLPCIRLVRKLQKRPSRESGNPDGRRCSLDSCLRRNDDTAVGMTAAEQVYRNLRVHTNHLTRKLRGAPFHGNRMQSRRNLVFLRPFRHSHTFRHSRVGGNPDERYEPCFSSPPPSRGGRKVVYFFAYVTLCSSTALHLRLFDDHPPDCNLPILLHLQHLFSQSTFAQYDKFSGSIKVADKNIPRYCVRRCLFPPVKKWRAGSGLTAQ